MRGVCPSNKEGRPPQTNIIPFRELEIYYSIDLRRPPVISRCQLCGRQVRMVRVQILQYHILHFGSEMFVEYHLPVIYKMQSYPMARFVHICQHREPASTTACEHGICGFLQPCSDGVTNFRFSNALKWRTAEGVHNRDLTETKV